MRLVRVSTSTIADRMVEIAAPAVFTSQKVCIARAEAQGKAHMHEEEIGDKRSIV